MNKLVSVLLLACLSLSSGCVTISKGMSEQPVDQYHGKRTFGAMIEDGSIRRKIRINLARHSEEMDRAPIAVHSFNGNVLLVGQVPDKAMKSTATEIAREVRHVRHVNNELDVTDSSSALARSNDGWLSTKIRTRLRLNSSTPGGRTEVITENGVVYLMGLLTREEAAAVIEQVTKVRGVQKIVNVVEYID